MAKFGDIWLNYKEVTAYLLHRAKNYVFIFFRKMDASGLQNNQYRLLSQNDVIWS